jgi:DNA-binding transcriptional ArsR family regulator
MELVWAAMLHADEPDPEFPVRAARFVSDPTIEGRIKGLWGDGEPCFTELFVVAERGGVVFEPDIDKVWQGLAAGAGAEPRFEPLASETPEDQERFRERLARLHDDADLRARWLELLQDVWRTVGASWDGEGRAASEWRAWDLQSKLPARGSYAELEAIVHHDFKGLLPSLVRDYAAAGHEVVVVPAWFGRKCFIVGLHDALVVSAPTPGRPSGPSEGTQSRARRFKALGDPTRLAILEAVARRARTVGELAKEMGVAQPTASSHVRILRQAGFLTQAKDGTRRLQVDSAALNRLAEESFYALDILQR